jgi:cephalosporin-C deacetylase-like acetyl esterase
VTAVVLPGNCEILEKQVARSDDGGMKAICKSVRLLAAFLTVALVAHGLTLAAELVVRPQPETGVVKVSQPVAWHVEWTGAEPPKEVRYTLKLGGRTEIDHDTFVLVEGHVDVEVSLIKPGALLATFLATSADGKEHVARGGAIVAPEEIQPSASRPVDFDDFWDAKLKEIAAVPFHMQLEKGDSGRAGVDYWKITLDGYRGTKIRGQLARPAESQLKVGEKLPAMLIPQWAGVYPLEKPWVTDRAADGWLVLNILAHDLPIDEPRKFYEQQFAGPLKDYWAIGNDDRETSYFLRMYLSCFQAAEYLTSRPDWDGETLIVAGGSQGGQQTLVTAAIHPRVTAALAIVPAGCDMLGPKVGRAPGWPQWFDRTQGKDEAKVREASRYYDVVNFAPRIKCPVLVGFGLVDEVCPAEGVMAAVNQITAPKEVVILPAAEHQEIGGSHQAYYKRMYGAWLSALRAGKPVPPKGD